MNIKQNYKKIIGLSLILNVIWLSMIGVLVLSQTSNTFTITSGVYPQASYTIWKEGINFYAKKEYGIIDYSGTDVATVINAVAQNTKTHGAYIKLMGYSNNAWDITQSIVLTNKTRLEGLGLDTTILSSSISDGSPVITTEGNSSTSNWMYDIQINNLYVKGGGLEGDGIYLEGCLKTALIEQVRIYNCVNGIHLYHSYLATIRNVISEHNSGSGLLVEYKSHALEVIASSFNSNAYGINLNSTNTNVITVIDADTEVNTVNDFYANGIRNLKVFGIYIENNLAVESILLDSMTGVTLYSPFISGNVGMTGIKVNGGNGNNIVDAWFTNVLATPINITSTAYNTIVNNPRYGGSVGSVVNNGVYTRFLKEDFYQQRGVATINASTSVVVNHGLSGTPQVVFVTLGTTGAGDYYVDTLTTTQFTVHVANSGTYTVYWEAEYQP